METDGGGWNVFQRRQDGSVDFYRNWTDYENGFGNLTGEFWLGLDNIHRLTKEGSTLRVDLGDFQDNTTYAEYSTFSIGNSTTEYTLSVGGYSGTAGDGLITDDNSANHNHNGMKFTTRDNDNDDANDANCAQRFVGAWWYNKCRQSDLNGRYSHNANFTDGIFWFDWKCWYSLKFTEMKTR